jgi:hypothetical protein
LERIGESVGKFCTPLQPQISVHPEIYRFWMNTNYHPVSRRVQNSVKLAGVLGGKINKNNYIK